MNEELRSVPGSKAWSRSRTCDFCARNPGVYEKVRCGCCGETYQAWYCPECRENVEQQPYCVGSEAVFNNLAVGLE